MLVSSVVWFGPLIERAALQCLRDTFSNTSNLEWVGLSRDAPDYDLASHDIYASEMCDTGLCIAGGRAMSCAAYTLPAWRYAGVTSDDVAFVTDAITQMRLDHEQLQELEHLAHKCKGAKDIRDDLVWSRKAVIRLLYALFERDGWDPNSVAGQRYIRTLCVILVDNKLVEDRSIL